ncbi:MAG: outer membrane beta-barrel family protein [Bacteroidota bacterium]
MKKIATIILLITNAGLFAQTNIAKSELYGSLLTKNNAPLPDAIVQLLSATDSSLVKTEFTNEKGEFNFNGISNGFYFIQTNVLGYAKFTSSIFDVSESKMLPPFQLQKTEVSLAEVTVTARKPYIERDHGKMILNVENSIVSSGNSAFEVIEKAPGVRIDNNDNISFKGKQGVAVWIDGRPTPMTGSDLANYLKGMTSAAIEKVEFIANPSSKYDAAGSSIINIKLKKDKKLGTNGSATLAAGYGVYPKTNNGFTLNHRNKKINVFGNYNYAYRKGFNSLKLDRNFYSNDTFKGAYIQDNYLTMDFQNQIARAGVDYYANSKNTFGFVVNAVSNKFNPTGDNISMVYDETRTNTSRFETQNRSKDKWYNYSANLNYKHIIDTSGTELTTDVDYARFSNVTEQNFTTRYFDINNNEFLNPYLLYGDINGGLNIYSIKTDLAKPLKNGANFESGFKSSYVIADNNLAFYNRSNGLNSYDSAKSNHFIYTENINAVYANASKEWKKLSTQIGLRLEHTHITGNQLVYNETFDTSYIQLFPSAFIGYKLNDKNSLELNYSRRINRPGYDQLNPFRFYLDPTTYKAGNPYLQPQTTHSFELTHVFKQKIYSTLGFGRTSNNITEVIAPAPDQPKLTIQTNYNLTTADVYALNVSIPQEVTKWCHTTTDISLYYAAYSGNIANTTINKVGNVNFNINSVNVFNFTSTFSGELSGNYRSKEVYAYETVRPIWSLNFGLQKKFADNRAILKLNVNDIFHTNNARATTRFTGYVESYDVRRDTRVAFLSFTYKFGNTSLSPSQRRRGGAEDVKQRAGGSVG